MSESALDGVTVAIAGATGAVGKAMLEVLESRNFPVKTLYLLASERSAGKRLQFRGKSHLVTRLDQFDFSQARIGLFSAGGSISAEFAPRAAAAGCVVMDAVYQPERTRLLRDAEAAGARGIGGKWILVHQAGEQIRLWTGRPAPLDVMAEAFDRAG